MQNKHFCGKCGLRSYPVIPDIDLSKLKEEDFVEEEEYDEWGEYII